MGTYRFHQTAILGHILIDELVQKEGGIGRLHQPGLPCAKDLPFSP